ncbi:MAG: glucose 1-dehydrogenase, partial [Acidobacteria bacterium]|nr:glucose 1-dehydrogenase [Acidobacteriota bacterium]
VLVKVLRVGLCGTDKEINEGQYGKPPEGDEYLILGHENFGQVVEVGKNVYGFTPGEFVVSTVRRPCHECWNCAHGENDMCTSGKYQERGIMRRHGFMAEYYSEIPEYLTKLPPSIESFGVLLEPMTVVEKGIDHSFLLQQRLQWKPKTAVILGAGPVGLLAAAVTRMRGMRTVVVGREPATDYRAEIAKSMEAEYVCVANTPLTDLPKMIGTIDLAIEATGVSEIVFNSMQILAPNGVLCLLSVTGGAKTSPQPTDVINQALVLRNNVVVGSVNANPRHFKMGVEDFVAFEKKYPGVLQKLITNRLPWANFKTWFTERGSGVKNTLEIAAAETALAQKAS